MEKINPSFATRFPVNRQNHTQKHPCGYVKPILQKLFCAEWNIKDKDMKKLLKGLRLKETLGVALVLRKYLNGCEGNGNDIEDIFNRLDGKPEQKLTGEGLTDTKVIIINNGHLTERNNFIQRLKAEPERLPE
jgi:hypothetical protein